MATINILEMSRRYRNEWVVLDRGLNVLDRAADLETLKSRRGDRPSGVTFYFVGAG